MLILILGMYSQKIRSLLKGIKESDKIKVVTKGKSYQGVLMPRSELGSPDYLVVKLDNGYNVGLKYEPTMKVKKMPSKPPAIVKKPRVKQNKKLPAISLLSTGGTIASKVDYKTGGVTAALDADDIIEAIPELLDYVYVKDSKMMFQLMSEDITPNEWIKMAKTVEKELNSGLKGVVITHGTDIMHYSSAALSFMLPNVSKPVVLVGSQRSTDRGSADSAMNLICSAIVAGKSDIAEVGICMHGSMEDNICFFNRGTKVRKMHTSRRDTFRPINSLPIAKVWPSGKIETLQRYNKRTDVDVKADACFEKKVALVKSYPGSGGLDILKYLTDKGYKGFVIEATGFGHVPTRTIQKEDSWIPTIKGLVEKGIPVVVSSQAIYGRVNPNVYTNLRILFHEAKAIPAEDMLPETAYVKLGWVLAHTTKPEKVREMMLTNYAGEISKRTLPETFLY